MSQKAVSILIGLMELALLAFTGSRTLDLLQQLLPANQAVFAYLGLVAFDGGLVGWSLYFVYGARGGWQRGITLIMIIVSLLAIGVSVISDLIISASSKGIVTAMPEQGRLAVLVAVGIIVFLNVAAFFLAFITEPDRLRSMAVESAKDKIHARSLALISQKADLHANDMAEQLSEQWVVQTYQQMGLQRQALPSAKVTPAHDITAEFKTITPETARLERLAEAAEKQGYSLDRLERMLGVESEGSGNGSKPF